jgi:hypothetical protein
MERKRIRLSKHELNSDIYHLIFQYLNIYEQYQLALCSKEHYAIYKSYGYKRPQRICLGFCDTLDELLAEMKDQKALYHIHVNKFGGWIKNEHIKIIMKHRRIFSMSFQGCNYITDPSLFSGLHSLRIDSTGNLIKKTSDLKHLANLHSLIWGPVCRKLNGLHFLKNLHTLRLDFIQKLDLSGIENIHTLELRECYHIINFQKLINGKIKILRMYFISTNYPRFNIDALRNSGTIVELNTPCI